MSEAFTPDAAGVQELVHAAMEVWEGRYVPSSGVQRNRQWSRLAQALKALGVDPHHKRQRCPCCGPKGPRKRTRPAPPPAQRELTPEEKCLLVPTCIDGEIEILLFGPVIKSEPRP